MATSRPKAVVTSASEMPADTEARPPEPEEAISWKAVMMPSTVPSSPQAGGNAHRLPHPNEAEIHGAEVLLENELPAAERPRASLLLSENEGLDDLDRDRLGSLHRGRIGARLQPLLDRLEEDGRRGGVL